MGWEVGNASKLKSSKSSASGTWWFAATDGGRAKASVHHDSQSNDGAGSGKGSETIWFLRAQSRLLGFLTVGSSKLDSDNRLFRERAGEGGELLWVEVGDGESERETRSVGSALNDTSCQLVYHKIMRDTHEGRFLSGNEAERGSNGSSEQGRFRFREEGIAPQPLSSEMAECVSDGVTDG